jgi:DNA repair exonuclease SbcCD ATPase subunit
MTVMQRRQTLQQAREAAQRDVALAQEPIPRPEAFSEDTEGLEDAVSEASARYLQASRFVTACDPATGIVACPTCGRSTETLTDQIAATRAQLPALQQAVATCRDRCRAVAAYEDAVQAQQHRVASLMQSIASLDAQLAQVIVPDVDMTTPDSVLQQAVAQYQADMQALVSHQDTLRQLEMSRSVLIGRYQAAQQAVQRLQQAAPPAVSAEMAETAAAEAPRLQEAAVVVQGLEQKLHSVRETRRLYEGQLREAVAASQRAAKQVAWRQQLQQVRDVLHRDAAPKGVMQRNLSRVQTTINEKLAIFDTTYRVTADPVDLSFIAAFPDGHTQPAERLSIGQKVLLALSFRLAMSELHAQLGFLVLDEPTAFLDEHHIAGFAPVLLQLREVAAARGLQCLMVTHEQQLAPLFDDVIQL